MIFWLIDLIIYLFVFLGMTYLIVFLYEDFCKRKGFNKSVNLMKRIRNKIKGFVSMIFTMVKILLIMFLSTLLALGLKPIIYQLNSPLGEGYSTFASYIIAICLYVLINDSLREKIK